MQRVESAGAAIASGDTNRAGAFRYVAFGVGILAAWVGVYRMLGPASRWVTYSLLGLEEGTHLSAAVEFFIFEVPKVLLLLTVVVFGVGIVRSFFTPERTRRILSGRRESVGNVLAALLGVCGTLWGGCGCT